MSEPYPMLRYVLAHAIKQVRDKNASMGDVPSRFQIRGPYYEETKMWRRGLELGCFGILGNSLPESDPCVGLIRRACRMIAQAGEIHWDEPANDVQREQEQEWLNEIKTVETKVTAKDERRRALVESRRPPVLTEAEKAALRTDPLWPENRIGSRIRKTCQHMRIDKDTFVLDHSIDSFYSDFDYGVIAAKMIRMGILDLVKIGSGFSTESANYCEVRLGPRYLDYMKRWDLLPYRHSTIGNRETREEWGRLIEFLNQRWGTSHKASEWSYGARKA